jgi:hypothetical protein
LFNLKPDTIVCAYVTQISVLGDLGGGGGRDLDEVIPNVVAFLVAFVGALVQCVWAIWEKSLGQSTLFAIVYREFYACS